MVDTINKLPIGSNSELTNPADTTTQFDIARMIYVVRGQQIMPDSDLAMLYQVETKLLNQAAKRNITRFPEEFRFQLTREESDALRSQFVTLKKVNRRGQHRKYLPYAFTEQGTAMLSAVLRSDTAIQVSIKIMKSFVEMRKFIASNALLFESQIYDAFSLWGRFCQDRICWYVKIYVMKIIVDFLKNSDYTVGREFPTF